MKTSDFDYDLPEELIADQPPQQRGHSRLLVIDPSSDKLEDRNYGDMIDYVAPGDVLVLNDTKVIPARLKVIKKSNGVQRELILLEKHGQQEDWYQHKVLYRGRLQTGDVLLASDDTELQVTELLGDGIALISSQKDLLVLAQQVGSVPLPPYMRREATDADTQRYQTVWARDAGSVAAPTASLNMTEALLAKLRAKGVIICYLTLHVGLGTFLPIRSDDLTEHIMHKEYYEIPETTVQTIQAAKQAGHKIIAIGTTVTRTLEYAAESILQQSALVLSGEADIFIYPGYSFKIIDSLLTNFHAPRSTVLMLAAAFAGWDHLLAAYHHAVAEKYHFLSYGDSMLITHPPQPEFISGPHASKQRVTR